MLHNIIEKFFLKLYDPNFNFLYYKILYYCPNKLCFTNCYAKIKVTIFIKLND